MYQLRIYTLASNDVAQVYFEEVWKKHLESLPKFGVTIHGIFKTVESEVPQVVALVSYEEGVDRMKAETDYMKSEELRYDMGTVNFEEVLRVDTLMLEEASYFPLKK